MKKNLLLFSGSTDPTLGEYPKRYNLIISEAKKRGYNHVQLLNWTGQKSSNNKGAFSMQNALIDAIPIIEKYNELKNDFNIIAFSWGCGIALRSLQILKQCDKLSRIILWGIIPYWEEYEAIVINKNKSILDAYNSAGCFVDDNYFKYQIPIEYLLRTYNMKIPLKIGIGLMDKNVAFLEYIDKILDNQYIKCFINKKLDHVVLSVNEEYLNFMFN